MAEDMTTVRALKKELRALTKERLSTLSGASVNKQSQQVTGSLYSLPEYQKARRISIYLSMPGGEISTNDLVHDAFQQGKSVFVPYTYKLVSPPLNGPKSVMDMVSLHSLEDYKTLEHDTWGIPTPSKASVGERRRCVSDPETGSDGDAKDPMKVEDLDMIVMPGMAFDRDLGRLGHGKGFYDFFLQRYQQTRMKELGSSKMMPFLVGLALEEQLLEDGKNVPADASDWCLDALIVGGGSVVRRH